MASYLYPSRGSDFGVLTAMLNMNHRRSIQIDCLDCYCHHCRIHGITHERSAWSVSMSYHMTLVLYVSFLVLFLLTIHHSHCCHGAVIYI